MSDSSHAGNVPPPISQDENEYSIRPDNPRHEAKIARALALLQQAQTLTANACQELCPLERMCPSYGRVWKLHDKIKREWHAVNNRRIVIHHGARAPQKAGQH